MTGFSSIREFYNSGVDRIFNQYYPFVHDQIVKNGKPIWGFLKGEACKYPVVALASSNLLIFYLAIHVTNIASKIISTLSFGYLSREVTSLPLGITLVTAANYGLYRALMLNIPVEYSIGVPVLTYCFCVLCYQVKHINRKARVVI